MDDHFGLEVERNVEIPMRDATILRANVFRPAVQGRFPALLERTPYGKAQGGMERYVEAGYVVVAQDSRGRYDSDGDYVPFTVEHTGDAEDGYDTVEWLAQQPYCNGKVGTMGASYNGWMQWELARLRPPHLVAMSAQTIPLELTEVDWPGAFKAGRRVKWWMTSMAPDLRRRQGLPGPHTPLEARKLWDEVEHGRWLGFLPWMELPQFLPPGLAQYAEDWLRHPNRRPWQFERIHQEVEVPNLDFTGWYDHCGGTMRHLGLMQENGRTQAAREHSKLVIGPWNHPCLGQREVCGIDFGSQAEVDLTSITIRWFDHWLKGVDNGMEREAPVRYFVMGTGKWKSAPTWPPSGREQAFYLTSQGDAEQVQGTGQLVSQGETQAANDSYTYDARDPVPTLWTRDLFSGPTDRRALEHRCDILYYRTPPLDEEIEVTGYPEAILFASSSAVDTDFFVRLIDEHPDGLALEMSYGMVRARHRNGLDCEDLLNPGEVVAFSVKLAPTACCFRRGHRIRLEITSSDFPNHDRNHNTGGNDLQNVDLALAQQSVFHGGEFSSRVLLPLVSG